MATPLIREDEEFEVVAETEVDSRGRVSLGRAGAKPGRRYRVESNIDGVLVLTPVVSIPEREMAVWRDPELAQRVRNAYKRTEQGDKAIDRGDFSAYLAEDD
jgi:hypothetical protein